MKTKILGMTDKEFQIAFLLSMLRTMLELVEEKRPRRKYSKRRGKRKPAVVLSPVFGTARRTKKAAK